MQKNLSEHFLNFIVKEVGGSYKIIDFDDIILSFPPSLLVTKEKVEELIFSFKNQGLINIKYNDGKSICLSCTEKAFSYEGDNVKEKEYNEKEVNKLFGWAFFGAFLGSFLGGIIISFIIVSLGG